jgi:hypothetical protein
LQVGDTGPVESARRSNSRVLGSPFSGLSGQRVWRGRDTDGEIGDGVTEEGGCE